MSTRRLRAVRGGRKDQSLARKQSLTRKIVTIGFAVAVLVIAGLGFAYKMTEFVMTIVNDDIAGFGAAAVGVYLIGMLPIVFLTLWAVMTGKFRDVEQPKFRMLELDREIERGGELGSHHG